MDPTRLVLATLGAFVAIVAPRFRYPTLMVFSVVWAAAVGTGVLLSRGAAIWMMVIGLPLLLLAAGLAARALPRLATFVALAIALALAALTVTGGARPGLWIALGVGVVLLALGTWKAGLGLLTACVVFGACLAWGFGPLVTGLAPWGATLAVSFVVGGLVMQRPGDDGAGPPWAPCVRWTLVSAGILAVSLATLPRFASDLAPTQVPAALDRRARLQARFPQGGLIWPLPSESILWDAPGFPAVENLDARYLGGGADAGLRKLPGPLPLQMRFALNGAVHQMRLIKDDHEIALLKRASRATVEALYLTLPLYQAGGNEGAIAESILRHSTRLGCESESFPPIIASGANALDFHYMKNDAPLVEGELVVTDIGCYADHYASDYTRTLPVGGRFSPRARELSRAVYEAERAAAAACRAGVFMRGRSTPDGSKSLDAVARETLAAQGAPSDFGHGIGHPIGLFAHDAFQRGQPLQAGMVIMIEPGVYIPDEGIGLRLENAYVVHDDGCELITGGIPSDPDGIERMMAEAFAPPASRPLVLPSPEVLERGERALEAPGRDEAPPAREAGNDLEVTAAPE